MLSEEDLATLREGDYKAAMVWSADQAFEHAVTAGAKKVFDEAGVEVVAITHPASGPADPNNDISSVLALNPDIVLAQIRDPAAAAAALRPAVDAGVNLTFLSTVPDGYEFGVDYDGMVTDDAADMGIAAAELLGDALGGKGEVGYLFHDANRWITNERDKAFKAWLTAKYPDIEIVAEQGFAVANTTQALTATMLAEHPDLDGIYAPWAGPAEGVLAALQAADREDVAVVTMDLRTSVALALVEGRNLVGLAVDEAHEIGRALAVQGLHAALGKPTAPFAVVPAFKVTADNIVEAYERAISAPPPPEVMAVLVPKVVGHPSSVTAALGRTAVFTASASGYPKPMVRWQRQCGDGPWRDLSAATGTTLKVKARPFEDGRKYRAVFTNKHGEAITNAATLTVEWPPRGPEKSRADRDKRKGC